MSIRPEKAPSPGDEKTGSRAHQKALTIAAMNAPQNVVELCQALVRIPSVNPSGNPGTDRTGEMECAAYVGAFLAGCGAAVELPEIKPDRPNVIGRFPSDRPGKPRIVFAPHTDTVSIVGMTIDPFGAELRDGKIWGRGASDTKGPMAAMLWMLWEMRERIAALPYEIWFAGLMSEEAGQNGAKAFAREHRADFAVVGEPTNCDIVHTHKGSVWLTLRAGGVAVHASTPERGENAIYKITDAVCWLRDELAPQLAQVRDPLLGAQTLNVGTISGGSKTNIVPDFCEATVDIRTVPAQNTQELVDQVSSRFPGMVVKARQSQPLFTDPSHPLIRVLEKSGGKCVGAPWFCDAAVLSEAGIPAVAVGPGSIAQAHTNDEWIAIDELARGVEFYRAFLLSS